MLAVGSAIIVLGLGFAVATHRGGPLVLHDIPGYWTDERDGIAWELVAATVIVASGVSIVVLNSRDAAKG
jgi:hypothetical protein